MKIFCNAIVATALLTSPAAVQDFRHRHQLNARGERAGEALSSVYVRTESESIHIASAYAFDGKICVALSSSGPAFQSGDEAATTIAYVVFDADGHTYHYNLDRSEFDESCEGASSGINVLVAVEPGVEGVR
jgi:hypothetical protein